MALEKGVNSYVDVAEADAYFADQLTAAKWSSLQSEKKSQALMAATRLLEQESWIGYVRSSEQPLAFPRFGNYYDKARGTYESFGEDVPQRVKDACCELALELSQKRTTTGGSVKSITVGPISLTDIMPASTVSHEIKKLFRMMVKRGQSTMWWRAN